MNRRDLFRWTGMGLVAKTASAAGMAEDGTTSGSRERRRDTPSTAGTFVFRRGWCTASGTRFAEPLFAATEKCVGTKAIMCCEAFWRCIIRIADATNPQMR